MIEDGNGEGGTDSLLQFLRGEQPGRFEDAALAVDPQRLDRIEPGALAGQEAGNDAHPARAMGALIVGADRLADRPAAMPRGVVPDQHQGGEARRGQVLAAPRQELGGDRTGRAAIHEAQPDRRGGGVRGIARPHQQPVAGQGLGIGIVLGHGLFHQPQRRVLGPGVQRGAGAAAPPGLVLIPHGPVGMLRGQGDQPVATDFFLAYAGSGLVIQVLARRQRRPSRASVARIVSSLTRVAVMPSAKAVSAASSSVQILVG